MARGTSKRWSSVFSSPFGDHLDVPIAANEQKVQIVVDCYSASKSTGLYYFLVRFLLIDANGW